MPKPILFHSNAPWAPTGYGNQTALFAPRLAETRKLAISAFYGLEGARLAWEGIPVFPGRGGDFGNNCLLDHATRFFGGNVRDGTVLTLMDVWVLSSQLAARMNTASWVPVDHDPAPPAVRQFFQASGAIPIAMSRFGEEQLADFDPLYVPHGVDTQAFSPQDKAEARKIAGVPDDAFLIGIVAANKGRPSRKSFQESLEAFRYFRERHDDAYLYLHTGMDPEHQIGEDLAALIASLQLPVDSVLVADQYRITHNPMPAETMARVYSTMNVLLNPARGEGFGIPVLEAAACGVPAIVTDFSAMPEVAGDAGWKVGCRPAWTGQGSWQAVPLVEDIVGALEEAYAENDEQRAARSFQARDHAEDYDADLVTRDYFLPALEEIEARIGDVPKVAA